MNIKELKEYIEEELNSGNINEEADVIVEHQGLGE